MRDGTTAGHALKSAIAGRIMPPVVLDVAFFSNGSCVVFVAPCGFLTRFVEQVRAVLARPHLGQKRRIRGGLGSVVKLLLGHMFSFGLRLAVGLTAAALTLVLTLDFGVLLVRAVADVLHL